MFTYYNTYNIYNIQRPIIIYHISVHQYSSLVGTWQFISLILNYVYYIMYTILRKKAESEDTHLLVRRSTPSLERALCFSRGSFRRASENSV